MKKVILAAVTLISVAFVGTANAQTASDNVIVNIKLRPIHTLVVNVSQKPVDLVYTTKNDYNTGVNSGALSDHLTVFSTGGFVVNVKSGGDFTHTASGEKIDAESVSVLAANGTAAPAGGTLTYTEQSLSVTEKEIIKSTVGGRDKNFNVTYKAAGADAYINKFDKDRGASENVYTATVTYTILAD